MFDPACFPPDMPWLIHPRPPPPPLSSSSSQSPCPARRPRGGRRQPPGHIPRPRNSFMIFRSAFLAEQKINKQIEHDHRLISRIIASLWHKMEPAEKQIWNDKATQEKADHMRKYPDYRFNPKQRDATNAPVKRKVKRNGKDELERCDRLADLIKQGKQGEELARAAKELAVSAMPANSDAETEADNLPPKPASTPKPKSPRKPRAKSAPTCHDSPALESSFPQFIQPPQTLPSPSSTIYYTPITEPRHLSFDHSPPSSSQQTTDGISMYDFSTHDNYYQTSTPTTAPTPAFGASTTDLPTWPLDNTPTSTITYITYGLPQMMNDTSSLGLHPESGVPLSPLGLNHAGFGDMELRYPAATPRHLPTPIANYPYDYTYMDGAAPSAPSVLTPDPTPVLPTLKSMAPSPSPKTTIPTANPPNTHKNNAITYEVPGEFSLLLAECLPHDQFTLSPPTVSTTTKSTSLSSAEPIAGNYEYNNERCWTVEDWRRAIPGAVVVQEHWEVKDWRGAHPELWDKIA